MNRQDYNKNFDNIRCSPEFKAKMEELLSEQPQTAEEGYADSVSHVEKAPKINYGRWAALAASAVIAVGIGGAGLMHMKNVSSETMPDDSSTEIAKVSSEESEAAFHYNLYVTGSCLFSDPVTGNVSEINFGTLPENVSDKTAAIVYRIREEQDEIEPKAWQDELNAGDGFLKLDFRGGDGFVFAFDNNSYGEYRYSGPDRDGVDYDYHSYETDAYYEIIECIARDALYLNWGGLYYDDAPEYGVAVEELLENYRDGITETDEPAEADGESICFLEKGGFTVSVDENGTIKTVFPTKDGYGSFYSKASPELYNELKKTVSKYDNGDADQDEENVTGDEYEIVCNLVDGILTEDVMDIRHHTKAGQGDEPSMLAEFDAAAFRDTVKSYSWDVSGEPYSLPTGGFYVISYLLVTPEGEIYDTQNELIYSIKDQDPTAFMECFALWE